MYKPHEAKLIKRGMFPTFVIDLDRLTLPGWAVKAQEPVKWIMLLKQYQTYECQVHICRRSSKKQSVILWVSVFSLLYWRRWCATVASFFPRKLWEYTVYFSIELGVIRPCHKSQSVTKCVPVLSNQSPCSLLVNRYKTQLLCCGQNNSMELH